jgi:hypothetical protein
MKVRTADPCPADSQDGIARINDLRVGQIGSIFDRLRSGEYEASHR